MSDYVGIDVHRKRSQLAVSHRGRKGARFVAFAVAAWM